MLDGATLADLLGAEARPDLARLLGIPGTEATDARAEVGADRPGFPARRPHQSRAARTASGRA
ncbi:hypothetical protein M446_4583 [Methylobacterium sp. 4-46]|nr:hypothetical protein M446_4583 [Methylobacterium sp. 4-46]